MDTKDILNEIDAEISRLQQVRVLLTGAAGISTPAKKRGRPVGSGASASAPSIVKGRRALSPEARAKIAAAQKLRWAKSKQATKKASRAATAKTSLLGKGAKSTPAKRQPPVETLETATA